MAEVVTVPSVSVRAEQPNEGKPKKVVLQSSGEAETSVFRLPPGGVIPRHHHSVVWDLFFGISGRGEIAYWDGAEEIHSLVNGSFCGMPPNTEHEVRNTSTGEDLVFALVHAPWDGYDNVRPSADRR